MLPTRTPIGEALTRPGRQSSKSAGRPRLQVSRSGAPLKEVTLDLPRLLIGRSKDNDISIANRYVSWHHMLLVRHGSATIVIDLNSTNGTFVNSKRVDNHVLVNDDVITLDLHSPFMEFSIRYCDPSATRSGTASAIESADEVIKQALADIEQLLEKSDTDVYAILSENVPTQVGILDDR